jgi:hypothetical protein
MRAFPSQVIDFLTVSHDFLVFIKFVLGQIHSKGQVLFRNQLFEFRQ